jgi:hypothetical protein
MEAVITTSPLKTKKYKVIIDDGKKKKTIHFGAKGYEDFTITKNNEKKYRYIDRHKSNEDWQDPFTAGFWALHTLWNKPTIQGSLNDIKRNFDIKIKNDI